MVSGITLSARECKWIVYFGETPNECRSRWAPLRAGLSPACRSARATIVVTARPLVKPRRGARIRTKTCRVVLGGLV